MRERDRLRRHLSDDVLHGLAQAPPREEGAERRRRRAADADAVCLARSDQGSEAGHRARSPLPDGVGHKVRRAGASLGVARTLKRAL